MTTKRCARFIYLAGILLVVGFIISLRAPAPEIFSSATVPVSKDELWQLNFR